VGYNTFLDIIDLDRGDLLGIPGIGPDEADSVLRVIDELTEEEGAEAAPAEGPSAEELAEAREVAAEILGITLPESRRGEEHADR
jgi:N utilization substance protein A